MPHIIVKLWSGQSEHRKLDLARTLIDDVCQRLELDLAVVSLEYQEIAPEHWERDVLAPLSTPPLTKVYRR